MSMMGELKFLLGLQIKQLKEGTFINQEKYTRDLLKRFNMEYAKTMKTPISSSIKLDKDEKCKSIDSTMYRGMIASSPLSLSFSWLLGESRLPLGHKASAQLSHFQPTQTEARQKARFDIALFSSMEDYQSWMDWLLVVTISEPIFPTLVRVFYSRTTYDICGPIISTVRGVEIRLDPESICHIFDIAPVGLKVMTRILPYGRFLTRVFKDANNDLSKEIDFEAPNDVQFEATFSEPMMSELTCTAGPSSQPSFTEPPPTEIPSHQAPHAPDHASWMDLSAQISSLSTCMKELAVVSGTRLYSMEDRMDRYQSGFTSQFEYLQQRFEHMKDCMD
ncbi:hypothetical protein CK203_017814 [Vitis vinifera]|uniref:Reverse transcriptase Ty1/copia-type domain-containing protein n=1 Tax=Vitis vinifera TaxID=29760 RepID=A0A438JHC4_VITVI|nr:hypothetical protein CK203_017814 [Vitis vinifera]